MKETWQLVEQQHGVWWAYQGKLPPSEASRPSAARATCRYSGRAPLA